MAGLVALLPGPVREGTLGRFMSDSNLSQHSATDGWKGRVVLGGFHLGRPQKFQKFLLPPHPLVRKFTQPPLLRLLIMSAFEGTLPPLLSADVLNGSPQGVHYKA